MTLPSDGPPHEPRGVEGVELVIDGRERTATAVLEGRAVAVRAEGRARRLVPLHDLTHVTVIGNVLLHADMIATCAASGAPIGITDGDMRLRALIVPTGVRRTSLGDALDRFRTRPDWRERLDDWRRARLSRLASGLLPDPAAAARAGWPPAQVLLARAARAGKGATALRLGQMARTWCCLMVTRILSDTGCPTRWMTRADDTRCDLVPLLGQVAIWRFARLAMRSRGAEQLAAALARDLRTMGGPGASLRHTARRIERPLRAALSGEVTHLHRWLIDMNRPGWHLAPEPRRKRREP